MLQEILLCLAGHPSPLLRHPQAAEASANSDEDFALISPPERALLSAIDHLSDLHVKTKRHADWISASHRSSTCKAVASAITSQLLQRFMKKIVEVERSILSKDAGYVGGYDIVPLSVVVGEFTPWTRRLEWLWKVVCFMHPASEPDSESSPSCSTGSSVMKFLRQESHTGYADLEGMALELVKTAEEVWLRQLSTWVLYGKLPSSGAEDFFIQPKLLNQEAIGLNLPEFSIYSNLVPDFVSPATASSILFIGQSLNQVRARDQALSTKSFSANPAVNLLPHHLDYLKTIDLPISSLSFTNVIASIRLSMSQNALSQLLPLPRVVDTLHILQNFLLLGRGEFAVSLISNADKRVNDRHDRHESLLPARKAGRLDNLMMSEGDLATVLSQTWSELIAAQEKEDLFDDTLERGQEMLRFVLKSPATVAKGAPTDFSGLLFPIPTLLTLSIQPRSPLAMFLTEDDVSSYSELSAYLIGIRRAEMHLESLWKRSSLRRCHPCPIGPPLSSTVAGERKLSERRKRENERTKQMRRYWAVASKAHFVISELGGYFQGEIVVGCWQHLLSWLANLSGDDGIPSGKPSRPDNSSLAGFEPSRSGARGCTEQFKNNPSSATSSTFRRSVSNQQTKQSDPATLAVAHQRYLSALRSSLLLNMTSFTKVLLDIFRLVDHLVALFARLQTAEQNLDLEIDEGVFDVLGNHRNDEHQVLQEMERSRQTIEERLDELVRELRESVDGSEVESSWAPIGQSMSETDLGASSFNPWRPRNIDSLLMKLEFIGTKAHNEGTDESAEDERYYSQ
jgi:Gamma tubulin complex component N-terminal/Gamma tubulin complex component C-terminal